MFVFADAARPTKLNIALWGPSGAGKTYTALALAHRLGQRVAVLDSEHRASALYTTRFPARIAEMVEPFSPERYIEAIHDAEAAGFDVLVIDSLSPEWDGPGGCLDALAALQQRGTKGARAWKHITPRHEALLGVINRSPLHLITTLREKPRVLLNEGVNAEGKKVTDVAAAEARPVMRERFEYEYDLGMQLDMAHRATIVKSRLLTIPEGRRLAVNADLLTQVHDAVDRSIEAELL